jgi:uncharacterized protein with HEPN domain
LPFREPALPLRDIVEAIVSIEQFTAGMDLDAFRSDPKTVSAIERKMLLISEAAVRLSDEAERLRPGQPWRDIRGIGNWLRHQYDRVDVETLWNTIQDDLPSLKAAVLQVLNPAPQNPFPAPG